MKRFVSILIIALLVIAQPLTVFAEEDGVTLGSGGETSPSVSRGGDNVHEYPTDTAIHGYRIYVAPKEEVFENNFDDIKPGSEYEDYAILATYVINKTRVSDGTTARVTDSNKFSFTEKNQTISDFVTLKNKKSGTWITMEDFNIYNGETKWNVLISLINNSKAKTAKVQGKTGADYPESCLADWTSGSTTKHFYTNASASILERNWAVEGDKNYFYDVLDIDAASNSVLNKMLQSKDITIKQAIESFRDYTVDYYSGKSGVNSVLKKIKDNDDLAVIIEPIFGYINDDVTGGRPAIMTASQYARWAMKVNSNWYDSHGIMHWYDKRSSVNNASANYEWGRTSNSTKTKLWSMTAFNYASTLRPYRKSKAKNKALDNYGGVGIIFPVGGNDILTMSIYCDYVYSVNDEGIVVIDSDVDTAYNVTKKKGGEGTFAKAAVDYDTKKDEATELKNTELIEGEFEGKVDKYYTFMMNVGKGEEEASAAEDLIDSNIVDTVINKVDISNFIEEFGESAFKFIIEENSATVTSDSFRIMDKLEDWVLSAINSSEKIKEKPKEDNSGYKIYSGLPMMDNPDTLTLLADEIASNFSDRSGLNITGLVPRQEWGVWDAKEAFVYDFIPVASQKDNIFSFSVSTDKGEKSSVDNLTTKYSGGISYETYGDAVYAEGIIPVTVGIVANVPEVTSGYEYFTYMENEDKKVSVTDRGMYRLKHKFDTQVSPFYEGITEKNKSLGKYFAFTFDNVDITGKEIIIDQSSLSKFVEKELGKYDLSEQNISSELKQISQAIQEKYNVDNVEGVFLGDGSTNKMVDLTIRFNKSREQTFGTNALIIEYIKLDPVIIVDKGGNNEADMREFELNTINNFYVMPPSVIDNRSTISDPDKRLEKEEESTKVIHYQRKGSPRFNYAPIIGGYDIQTVLSSSDLNPAFIWTSIRDQQFETAGATGNTKTDHELYVISRANLGDVRAVADYSIWNNTDYKATELTAGATTKSILSKLGVGYKLAPETDRSNQDGDKKKITKTGVGEQSIVTAKKTGWVVEDTYMVYKRDWIVATREVPNIEVVVSDTPPFFFSLEYNGTRTVDDSHWGEWYRDADIKDTQYVQTGKFHFSGASGSNGNVTSAGLLNSRNYDISYTMASYVSYTASKPETGSKNTFKSESVNNTITEKELGKSKIVNSDALLTSIDLTDKSKTILGIYPEVLMMYKVPASNNVSFNNSKVSNWVELGDEYQGYNNGYGGTHTGDDVSFFATKEKYVFTAGEKARYFNPTSFMTLELYGKNNLASNLEESDVSGKLVSNGFSTSSKIKNLLSSLKIKDGKTPVMLSGAEYTLATERLLNLELTSYSIDIAADGDGVISASNPSKELNMKSTWSNLASDKNYSAEVNHNSFVKNTLQDMKHKLNIIVDADKTQINEELKLKAGENKEISSALESTYNIYIRHGKVVNKDDIINAIAHDLLSEDTNAFTNAEAIARAQEIYKGLDIEKMIIPQLESSTSTTNKSDTLPSGSKWYDEACSTLVIRKYVTRVSVGNVTASDKLDVTWGAKQKNDRTQLYTDGNKAGFKYYLGFDKITLPSGQKVNVDKPLVDSIIKDCNFVIPDATVSDSRY